MIGRLILWLCVIWIPAMEYAFMANETKFKKNIVIGVTLPHQARTDPEVAARLGRFKRNLGIICLALTALGVGGLLLPVRMGLSLTLMLVYTDLVIVLPMIPYVGCNRDLKALKAGRGWRGGQTAGNTVTVDLAAAAQPVKELSFAHFLPPLVVSLIPAVWEMAMGEPVGGAVMLILALCIVLFYFLYRYAFRRRSEVVDDDTSLTETLTRLRRQYWRRTWLWVSWFMALFAWCMELAFYFPLAGFAGVGVLTLLMLIACLRLEFGMRRAQEKLTAGSGTGWYVDEDDKWLWGMFYYDPHDRRIIVNNRVGINTTVNLARRGGQVFMGLCAALLIFMPLLGVWLMGEENAPVELALTDTALVASHAGSEYEIPLEDIQEAQLLDELPDGLRRVAGTAMDTVSKGRYRCNEWGSLELCIDPREGPWLLVTTAEGKRYLFGAPGVTAEIAAALEREVPAAAVPADQ